MTDQPLFGDTPKSAEDALRTQLSAVNLLIARTDRQVAQHDIMIATCLELLAAGPLTSAQLHGRVCEAWPGIRITVAQLDGALDAVAELDHVELVPRPGRSSEWRVRPTGQVELDESTARSDAAIDRFKGQIRSELLRQVGQCGSDEVSAISDVLIKVIRRILSECFRVPEEVPIEKVGGWLRVAEFDIASLDVELRRRVSEARFGLVRSLAHAALDQTVTLGSELVHHLVAGHVLYLFMARPDEVRAAARAGSLEGEIVLLDTTVLVGLTGPIDSRQPLLDLLGCAKRCGLRLVVLERTIDEFNGVIQGLEDNEVQELEPAIQKGGAPGLLAQLQRSSEPLRGWLKWAEGQRGPHRSWSAYRTTINGPGGPLSLLTGLGVESWPDTAEEFNAASDTFDFTAITAAMRERIAVSPGGRGDKQIDHDARLLHLVKQLRDKNPSSTSKIWPGAFILTTDRQMEPAFGAAFGGQRLPVVVTTSLLAQLAAAYVSAEESERLALQAADTLFDDLLIRRGASLPPEAARLMAMALADDVVSEVEVEQLELELQQALDERSAEFDDQSEAYGERVRQVLDHRRVRLGAIRDLEQATSQSERNRQEMEAEREVAARRLAESELQAVRDGSAAKDELLKAKDQLIAKERSDKDNLVARGKREKVLLVLAAVWIGTVILQFVLGSPLTAAASLLVGLFGYVEGRKWVDRQQSALAAILAAVVSMLTVIGFMIGIS